MSASRKFKFDTNDFEPIKQQDESFTPHDFEPIQKPKAQPQEDLFTPKIIGPTTALQMSGQKTYENPTARNLLFGELSTLIPPVRGLGAIGNALGNIGIGTLASTAMDLPEINNLQDLQSQGKKNLELNALLQGALSAAHLPSQLAEIQNPLNFTKQKVGEIQQNYANALANQKMAYGNVTNKWGDFPTSLTPAKYLGFSDKTIKHMTPDIEVAYDQYLKNPSFQNLHNLQVIMGDNVQTLGGMKGEINQYQSMKNAHRQVKNKINSFLNRDKNALNEYNQGVAVTRDILKPYESNETLAKVAKGIVNNIEPIDLAKAIKSGSEKLYGRIPEGHYLNALRPELEGKIGRGKAVTELVPENVRKYIPNVFGQLQNPYTLQLLENVNPLLQGLGRQYIANQTP